MKRKWQVGLKRFCLCALIALILAVSARAASNYWQHDPAAPGDWFDLNNWSLLRLPTLSDYVYINNGGEALIASGDAEAETVYLGYSDDDSGTITQTGGTHTISYYLYLAYYDSTSRGTYELSGTGQLSAKEVHIGRRGTGTFLQSGGTNTIEDTLTIGRDSIGVGTYELSGDGELSVNDEYIGYCGTGHFIQTGGTHIVGGTFYLSYNYGSGSVGTYELSGTGQLDAACEYVGQADTGTFLHSGGTNTVGTLYIGRFSTSNGTYELSGTGQLFGDYEYIGTEEHSCVSTFTQTGGSNTAAYLYINSASCYDFAGGMLQINDGLCQLGTLDFGGRTTTLSLTDVLVKLSEGIERAQNVTFNVGGNSLVILPPGFDPDTVFGDYNNTGMTHTAGSTLVVPAGEGFSGCGYIDDYVQCEGTISAAADRFIYLNNGLSVSGSGSVNLGSGSLTVDNAVSGISDTGSISAPNEYIGHYGTGVFTQTGGTNTISDRLYLGYYEGSSGTYELEGGQLSANIERICTEGAGRFVQTGGANAVSGDLHIDDGSGTNTGIYEMRGGQLTVGGRISIDGTFAWFGGTIDTPEMYFGGPGPLALAIGFDFNLKDLANGDLFLNGGTVTRLGRARLEVMNGATATQDTGRVDVGRLRVGSTWGSGVYSLQGAELFAQWGEYIGYSGEGRLTQIGGSNTVYDGDLYVGYDSGAVGTYELTAGSLALEHWDADEYIGYSGIGTFIQTDGTNATGRSGNLYLGYNAGSHGTYQLSGVGELASGRQYIGYEGTGEFTQTGGINAAGSEVFLGYKPDAVGSYELGGDGQLSAGREFIGGYWDWDGGTGHFTQTGGTHTIEEKLFMAVGGPGAVATYDMSGGALSADIEYIGRYGTGQFTQSGGTHAIANRLYLGWADGSSGTYELSGDAQLSADYEYIGCSGPSQFTQTGGVNTVNKTFCVASSADSTYSMSGGQLTADIENIGIGCRDTGQFIHTGGVNTIITSLSVASGCTTAYGIYELSGGAELFAKDEYVGRVGIGSFTQTGGSNTVSLNLYLGYNLGADGTYELSGTGQLSATNEYVGYEGTGRFTQTGGTNRASSALYLGYEEYSTGVYELSGDGQLEAGTECVGIYGWGTFLQTGGTNTVKYGLHVGTRCGYDQGGLYVISAGSLSTPVLLVSLYDMFNNDYGQGMLAITQPTADIKISSLLHFGPNSGLVAVPGATIHMTGSVFENENADPATMTGLANLTLIFEGGTADVDPFEVAGKDLGAVAAGWTSNFVLGTLQLGGVDVGKIQLVNNFDNQPDWVGNEALYVNNLVLNEGAYIDLNALNAYYLNGGEPKQLFYGDANLDGAASFADYQDLERGFGKSGAWAQGDFNGDGMVTFADYQILERNFGRGGAGSPTPEPATVALMALGTLGAILLRKR